jgi:GxxExxY protein
MTENEISYEVRGAIYKVYNNLGPGLLENIYEAALIYELKKAGYKIENQVPIPIIYDGCKLNVDYKLDILVEDKVIVELKSVSEMKEIFYKQLLTYLRLTHKRLGLLVNFNTNNISDSTYRIVNNL